MKFTYTYRSSDGERHTAEVEAESRDAAFAKVRNELGIKPIKVVAAASPNSASPRGNGALAASSKKLLVSAAVLCAAVLGGMWWWFAKHDGKQPPPETITVNTPQGPVTLRVAEPLPRQTIPGDRRRIEAGRDTIFTNAVERLLARFAEPGRAVAALDGAKPGEADFRAALRESIRIASTDFTEVVDLKRIVTGMKREMRAYLAGGGTVDGYLAELEKRQRLEVSYRERAEKRLEEMLVTEGRDKSDPPNKLKTAYAYWLKANAQLQAMGIYPLALPDALRSYQMSLDIEE